MYKDFLLLGTNSLKSYISVQSVTTFKIFKGVISCKDAFSF